MRLRNFLPILTFYFAFYVARGISTLVIPLYLSSINLSIVLIGVGFATFGLGILLSEIIWGYVLDRIGVSRTVSITTVFAIVPFLLFPFARDAEATIAIQFVYGISAPAMTIVVRALVAKESGVSGWGGGFGLIGSLLSVALFAGSLAGGGLASFFGLASSFYFCAALMLASYAFYMVTKRSRVVVLEDVPERPSGDGSEGNALHWFSLLLLGSTTVPIFMSQAFFTSIMPVAVTTLPSLSGRALDAAVMIALLYLSLTIFQPLLGSLGAGRAKSLIVAGLAGNALVFLALTRATSIIGIDMLAFLSGICFSVVSPLSLSLLMLRTPKPRVGTAMGIYGAAEDVGVILGPLLGGIVWAQSGIDGAYLMLASSFAIVVATFAVLQRHL